LSRIEGGSTCPELKVGSTCPELKVDPRVVCQLSKRPVCLEALHLGWSYGLMTHYVVGRYGNVIGPIADVRVLPVAVTTKRYCDNKTL
jgi:hypothetical protein